MRTMNNIWTIAKYNYIQQIRSKKTLVMGIFIAIIIYFLFPSKDQSALMSTHLQSGTNDLSRSIYDSKTVGLLAVNYFLLVLAFGGFFLIKDSLIQELKSNMGDFLFTSSLNKFNFYIGKWSSNVLYLLTFFLVAEIMAIISQILSKESHFFTFRDYLLPFLVIVLPTVFLISSLPIVLASIPYFRKTLGSILNFCLVIFIGMSPFTPLDIAGIDFTMKALMDSFFKFTNISDYSLSFLGSNDGQTFTFLFPLDYSFGQSFLLIRSVIAVTAIILVILMAFLVPFKTILLSTEKKKQSWRDRAEKTSISFLKKGFLKILPNSLANYEFLNFINGRTLQLLLIILFIVLQYVVNNAIVLTLATIIPLFMWSNIGASQKESYLKGTISYPMKVFRSTIVYYSLFSCLYFSGSIVYLVHQHNNLGVFSLLVGCLFIVSIAYLSTTFFSTPSLFEGSILFLWYMGMVQKIDLFDFTGIVSLNIYKTIVYLLISITLLIIVYLKKAHLDNRK